MKKTLVITGASKGIGQATARLFQENGFNIVNISRSTCPLDNITQINADLSDIHWVEQQASNLLKAIDGSEQIVLIHCAAAHKNDTIAGVEASTLQSVLQTNIVAPSQLTQLLLPHMKTGSSVLFLGSTLSEKAVAGSFSYVTSKHAVVGMMRSTCQDLAGTGIHTACICPGFTNTEMLREHVGGSEEVLQNIAQLVTFNRLIEPEEIASSLWFCASSAVINGAVIHANLGQIES